MIPKQKSIFFFKWSVIQGSLLFVTYTIIQSIISSEMQVELKKNTAWAFYSSYFIKLVILAW